jgi:hypothetical protein
MQALAWWAIPLVATAIAIAWAVFAARPKGPDDALDTIEAHKAFREALSRPTPPPVADAPPPAAAESDSAGSDSAADPRGDRPAA